MTSVSITGPITEIVIGSNVSVSTVILTPENFPPWDNPGIVEATGSPLTIVLVDSSALYGLGLGVCYFVFSSDFNVGDLVEVYNKPGTIIGSGIIFSNDDGGNLGGNIPAYRKVLSGTTHDWVGI